MTTHKILELTQYYCKFPIGVYLGNKVYKSFSIKDLTGRHEIVFGKIETETLKQDDPDSIFVYAKKICRKIFDLIIEDLEGDPLEVILQRHQISLSELIDKLYLVDVLTLFITVRINGYGRELRLSGKCPCEKQLNIVPSESDTPHDLGSFLLKIYESSEPPLIEYHPLNPIENLPSTIYLRPPLFSDLPKLIGKEAGDRPVYLRLIDSMLVVDNPLDCYVELSRKDRINIRKKCEKINELGLEKEIPMDCPHCGFEWNSPLINGYNYEFFFLTMLSIQRQKDTIVGENPAQKMLDQIGFFLSTGEQAPFSNPESVYDLTVSSRNFWVSELSNTYKKQNEEMKKNQAKSKGRKPRKR